MERVLRVISVTLVACVLVACGSDDKDDKAKQVIPADPVKETPARVPAPPKEVERQPAPLTNEQIVAAGGRPLIESELVIETEEEMSVEPAPDPVVEPVPGQLGTVVFIIEGTGEALPAEETSADMTYCLRNVATFEDCHMAAADKIFPNAKYRRTDTCFYDENCGTKGHQEATYEVPRG